MDINFTLIDLKNPHEWCRAPKDGQIVHLGYSITGNKCERLFHIQCKLFDLGGTK